MYTVACSVAWSTTTSMQPHIASKHNNDSIGWIMSIGDIIKHTNFVLQQIHATTHCNQTYLTTVHSNSWDCPILSLSQLLPDTSSDLISDTRSALLRDSLWWEADKEEGSNNDQNHCCHLGSCLLCSHTICYSLLEYSLCRALNWQSDKLQLLLLGRDWANPTLLNGEYIATFLATCTQAH